MPKASTILAAKIERAQRTYKRLRHHVLQVTPAHEIDPEEADSLLRSACGAVGALLDLRHLNPDDEALAACNANVIAAAAHLHAAHAAPGDQPRQEHWDALAEALLARTTTVDAYLLRRYRADLEADNNPTQEP